MVDDVEEAFHLGASRKEKLDGQVADHVGRCKDDEVALKVVVTRLLEGLLREVPGLLGEVGECETSQDGGEEEGHPWPASYLQLKSHVDRHQNRCHHSKLYNPIRPHLLLCLSCVGFWVCVSKNNVLSSLLSFFLSFVLCCFCLVVRCVLSFFFSSELTGQSKRAMRLLLFFRAHLQVKTQNTKHKK